MAFTNIYYKRTTATPGPCYVCCKPTTTVLATINTVDWLRSCPGHLSDPNFATEMGESGDGAKGSRKMGLNAEEIKKVKEEWEERQRQKKDKDKDKEKDKEKEKDGSKDKDSKSTGAGTTEQASTSTPSAPQTPAPTHQRYTLHRDFFAMRLADHRKRRNVAQAKELAPRLPTVPQDPLPNPV